MTAVDFDPPAGRPVWLTTLADLALLLLGFFVLVQATDGPNRARLAAALRAGFGVSAEKPPVVPPSPMAMETARVAGFARGSATLPSDLVPLIGWAQAAAHDPRVRITITGSARADEDQAVLLAYDRARAVAGRLVSAGAVSADRIEIKAIEPGVTGRAEVTLALGFGGDRPSDRQGDRQDAAGKRQ